MSDRPCADEQGGDLSPDEAFAILANETRIAILRALWDAYDPFDDEPISFSDLYRLVGLTDSGRFNYHLEKLVGHYVRQTANGYELTTAGFEVVQTVLAGTAIDDPTLEPTPVDERCPRCDSLVTVRYREEQVEIDCTDCAGFWGNEEDATGVLGWFGLPPAGIQGRDPGEILRATIASALRKFELLGDGVCPDCSGIVDATLHVCEDHEIEGGRICETCGASFLGQYTFVCRTCKGTSRAPSFAPALWHPAVTAFYHDHGIEHEHNSWETARLGERCHEELVSTHPPRVRIAVRAGEDELRVTLDERTNVVAIER